tara:strand:- start:23 stop:694 length:672 start_codon:yes stop_codon:yes gene_type:complete
MNDLTIREKDLFDNPTPRVPIALVLDTSSSMLGEPIEELNDGVKMFFEELKSNPYTEPSAEVCVVTFNSFADCVYDFQNISKQTCPNFIANGSTSMNQGVNLALDKLQQAKDEYKNAGVDYYQPWMVLMTDGEPTEGINESVDRVQKLISDKKIVVFPIAIGDYASMETLGKYSPDRQPLKLQGLNFSKFFQWLSASVEKVSQSMPGDKISLDVEGIKGWAEL